MRSSFQFAAVVLLLVLCVAPAMPCMFAGAQTMAPAHACCHMMKTGCGHLRMPASSSCCKAVPQNQPSAALDAKTPTLRAVALNAVTLPVEGAIPGSAAATYAQAEHSPPQSPPNILSSLRV